MNPDIVSERANLSFSVEQLSLAIYGEKTLKHARDIEKMIAAEPWAHHDDVACMDFEQAYSTLVKKNVEFLRMLRRTGLKHFDAQHANEAANPWEFSPLALHALMFIPTLEQQCTEEQKNKWLPLARNYNILGTYVQTEMGHGTFIRGIETTATFDEVSDEFVLHSPTVTSTKWWASNLGKSMNYAVVMALLWTRGECKGPHVFVVQLRDLETHRHVRGVSTGDLGPKLWLNTNDNGWLRFDHVRIPRSQMLANFAEVSRDGEYTIKKDIRLSYGTMVYVRSLVVYDCFKALAAASTIAARYSCVRRQCQVSSSEPELKVIEFQMQQFKVIPNVTTSYAMLFAALNLRSMYERVSADIANGKFKELPQLHALSSGLKAHFTLTSTSATQQCLLACGGHGFSHSSGVPRIYGTLLAACIYEGDSTVLYLQAARFLTKLFGQGRKGALPPGPYSYLSKQAHDNDKTLNFETLSVIDRLEALYRIRAYLMVQSAATQVTILSKKQKPTQAWNNCGVELVAAARAHMEYFCVYTFALKLRERELTPDIRKLLSLVFENFCLFWIQERASDFALIPGIKLPELKRRLCETLAELRPFIIPLTDAFDLSDYYLRSILGRYDGRVYENMLQWTEQSALNRVEVLPVFESHVRPLMKEFMDAPKM